MDDIYFLYVARQICAHPADPFGFRHNWDGTEVATTQITRNGPLNGYYVAAAAACLGWSEAALHLAFLVPAVAAVLGAYFLAVRFCTEPLLAALTTLLCPAFMVCSTTIMADTMMLAFFVWAVVLWLRSAESGSHFVAILSGCLIAAASMTRFFALVSLVPLLLAYSLLRWRRIGWRVLYLTIPLAVFADYECAMRALYGYTPLYHAGSTALVQGREGSWLVWRGIVTLCFAGGSLATLIFDAPMLWSRRVLAAGLLGVGLLAGLLACRESLAEDTLPSDGALRLLITFQFSVFVGAGFSLLVLAIADLWQSRDAESALLALWTLGTLAFCWIFNWTINGRTMLSMAPAASILIFRRIQQRAEISTDRHLPGKLLPLVLAGLLAAATTWADSRLANRRAPRRWSFTVATGRRNLPSGLPVTGDSSITWNPTASRPTIPSIPGSGRATC